MEKEEKYEVITFNNLLDAIDMVRESDFDLILLDNALEGIKNDGYYDIIILRYFKEWTIDEIAEDFDVDRRTIGRNRTRLIKKLQYSLFPEVLLD